MTALLLLLLLGQKPAPAPPPPTPRLWGVAGPAPTAMPHRTIEWLQDVEHLNDLYWCIYRVYIDDLPPMMLVPMCKGDYPPYQCSAAMPNHLTTPGTHRLTVTVSWYVSGDSVQAPSRTGPESPKSNEVTFVVKQPPPAVYVPQPTGPNTAPSVPVIVK